MLALLGDLNKFAAMARSDMPPGAQDFLRRVCQTLQNFDEEGHAVLPVRCWRLLLQELGLQEDSEGAFFAMDYVEPAGEGYFTYAPLLKAAGIDPLDAPEKLSDLPQDKSPRGRPLEGEADLHYSDIRDMDGYHRPAMSGDMDGYRDTCQYPVKGKGHEKEQSGGREREPAAAPPDLFAGRRQLQQQQAGHGLQQRLPQKVDDELEEDGQESVAPQLEVVDESFWSRRGPAIQNLFHKWDCNRLSNEAFQDQMQDLLGESVDITHPESEFFRLISKHRSARTMKFASLMSGLRRDAHNTLARLTGGSCMHGGNSSYAGSVYDPSEAGSEALSHAAGRPSGNNLLPGSSFSARGGRRHFVHGGDNPVVPREYQPPRLGQLPEDEVQDFSNPTSPAAMRKDRSECMSVISDAASVADSQREAFSIRNRTGHGNILTWGNDSTRAVTPPKNREGRQLAFDPDVGIPRSQLSSGIFPGKR
eukprot:TRINITY_DN9579_c0_g1_i4.p1 TRINITY_DN9579_c0_g1~~TRINITY_DN9579_c0_g1_i4.p1  ORF type:complete len:476 (+),score=68.25 TRINITY_DN9579_c0_g1_i4:26-1453(+)